MPNNRDDFWYPRPVFFVADLSRSLQFYLHQLGFTKKWHAGDGAGSVCQVNRSDCEIILSEEPGRSAPARLFIELTPGGLAALRRDLGARDVPHDIVHWGYDVVRVVDPDGNELFFPIDGTQDAPEAPQGREIEMASADARLRSVRLLHTVAWAFFASCVVLIPWAASARRLTLAAVLIGVVAVESVVLMLNGWRCPLTDVAARYTEDRRPNFDIYLPSWLAEYNKQIFGALYVVGIAWTLFAWLAARAA